MLTQKESQEINLDLSSHYGPIYQLSRDESQHHPNELSNPYKTEKTNVKGQLIARAKDYISLETTANRP